MDSGQELSVSSADTAQLQVISKQLKTAYDNHAVYHVVHTEFHRREAVGMLEYWSQVWELIPTDYDMIDVAWPLDFGSLEK